VDTVVSTTKKMSVFIKDIEQIGDDVELVAQNAQIKAAHIGYEGKPLGILAETAQQLSTDARDLTTSISGILKKVASYSGELFARVKNEAGGRDRKIADMHKDVETLIGILLNLNKESASPLNDIDTEGRALSEDITKVREGIKVHGTVKKVTTGIISGMEDISSQSRLMMPAPMRDRMAFRERMAERFTALPVFDRRALSDSGADPSDENRGLETNVELF
jgi:methyl-accepting chemotaxis protein